MSCSKRLLTKGRELGNFDVLTMRRADDQLVFQHELLGGTRVELDEFIDFGARQRSGG